MNTLSPADASSAGDTWVILSDLHLGADPPDESSFYEASFGRFLDNLCARGAADKARTKLVLLGDTLDLWETRLHPGARRVEPVRTSLGASLAKLGRLARDHPLFFSSLGRLASCALQIDVVIGNHDIELIRPLAQERFVELVARISGCAGATWRIRFHPWIYTVPGVLYAEHGNQYHDINWFSTILQPYADGGAGRLRLPIASAFTRAGKSSGPHRVLSAARGAGLAIRRATDLWGPGALARRDAYRRNVLEPYATGLGLDYGALVAIDRLSEAAMAAMPARLLRKMRRRALGGERPPTQLSNYLHRAALGIDQILRSAGAGVPFYVFGHTHVAERFPLTPGRSTPEYLNSGTWSRALPGVLDPSPDERLLTFVEITSEKGGPLARLLCWDDTEGCTRPFPGWGRGQP